MKQLPSKFESREALTELIAETFEPVLIEGHRQPSPIHGQVLSEAELAESVQPARYARTRNFYDGVPSPGRRPPVRSLFLWFSLASRGLLSLFCLTSLLAPTFCSTSRILG